MNTAFLWSLVLKSFFTSFIRPTFAANSLMRSSPPSEERFPPLKFILIFLLLSSEIVFKIDIRGLPFLGIVLIWHLNFTKKEVLFLFTF